MLLSIVCSCKKDILIDDIGTTATSSAHSEKNAKVLALHNLPDLRSKFNELLEDRVNGSSGILSLVNIDTTRVQVIEVDSNYTIYTMFINHGYDFKIFNLAYVEVDNVFSAPSVTEWHMTKDFALAYNAGQKTMAEFEGTLAQYKYNSVFNNTVRSGEIDCDCLKLYLHLKGHSGTGNNGGGNGDIIGGGVLPGWSYGEGEGGDGGNVEPFGSTSCLWDQLMILLHLNGEVNEVEVCTPSQPFASNFNGGFNNRNSEDDCVNMLKGIGLMESSNNQVNAPAATPDPFEAQLSSCRSSNPAVRQRMQELVAQEVYDACNGLPIIVHLEDMERELCSGCHPKGYSVEALEEMYEAALFGKNTIEVHKDLNSLCPRQYCIIDKIMKKQIKNLNGTEFNKCFANDKKIKISIEGIDFSANGLLANGDAAISESLDGSSDIAFYFNTSKCNSPNLKTINIASTIFHELLHANFRFNLIKNHGWDGTPATYQTSFNSYVSTKYPTEVGILLSEHHIMIRHRFGTMVQDLYDANGQIGNPTEYYGFVLNGFSDEVTFINSELNINSVTLETLIQYSLSTFDGNPVNISPNLTNCP